eukprot:680044-Amphidinium_carterae.1
MVQMHMDAGEGFIITSCMIVETPCLCAEQSVELVLRDIGFLAWAIKLHSMDCEVGNHPNCTQNVAVNVF